MKGKEILRWIAQYTQSLSILHSLPPNLTNIMQFSKSSLHHLYIHPVMQYLLSTKYTRHWTYLGTGDSASWLMINMIITNYELYRIVQYWQKTTSYKMIRKGQAEATRVRTSGTKNEPDMWKFVNSLSRLRGKQPEKKGMTGSDLNFKITLAAVWNWETTAWYLSKRWWQLGLE